jgi:hypothetical protein
MKATTNKTTAGSLANLEIDDFTELDASVLASVGGGKGAAGSGCHTVQKVIAGVMTAVLVCGASPGGSDQPHVPEGEFPGTPGRPPVVQTTKPTPPPLLGH